MSKIVILDTETTGTDTTRDRLLSVSLIECDNRLNKVRSHLLFVQPDGFLVKAQEFHGLTDAFLRKHGQSLPAVLRIVDEAISGYALPVAYNAPFDKGILLSEFGRAGMHEAARRLRKKKFLDPMGEGLVKDYYARIKRQSPKKITQPELFKALFGTDQEDTHLADADTANLLRILKELAKLKVINIGVYVPRKRITAFFAPILASPGIQAAA